MRQIGYLSDERQARLFIDYLVTQGISAQTDTDESGWAVWVRDENDVESAKSSLALFEENPSDSRYRDVAKEARRMRDAEIERRKSAAKHTVEMRNQWSQPLSRRAPLVMTLIGLSVALSLFSNFGDPPTGTIMRTLGFANLLSFQATGDGLLQIRQGQLWRLVTPIFLHGDPLHLVFNMYWLYVLGAQVESRKRSLVFGGIVLGVAVFSNLAQYFLGSGPNFLGMSGVVYGLLGYIWIKQQFDPASGFQLHRITFLILIGFLALGFLGVLDSRNRGIANWAHAGGLVAGMAIAYFPFFFPRRKAGA